VTIGVLGGGQLGRMLALAGVPLGLDFVFLDPAPDACAAGLGRHLRCAYDDASGWREFIAMIDIATYEFENVPLETAAAIAAARPLRPGAAALRVGQDRLQEKRLFEALGLALPRYAAVDSAAELEEVARAFGLPAVLKTRRLGYDGKGQWVLRSAADVRNAASQCGDATLVLEELVDFAREVSCLGVRGLDGSQVFYPLVENVHRNGILHLSRPQPQDDLQESAQRSVAKVAERLDYVGVLAIEFFDVGGRLLANEMAPRVHNSGHWSIEGAECSQFENHLRAISGLPLGSTRLRGASAMLNFIGQLPPREALLEIAGLHAHVYGKSEKPGRKVGHATITAGNAAELERRLLQLQGVSSRLTTPA
jgi:5-(carboxyamino)imidazole ribonucleotide synthase